jgi:cytochrome c oxidase subunit 2
MSLKRVVARLGALVAMISGLAWAGMLSGAALADDTIVGQPLPNQIGLQPPRTSLARELVWLHNVILTPIVFIIAGLVMALLLIVIFRFNAKANPVPTKTTHNTVLEVAWTGFPVLILVFISIFSFRLLYNQLIIPKPDLTLKAIGHQWYWSYVYPDNGNFTFDAHLVTAEEAVARQKNVIRLLDTDNEVVLPIHKNIRVQVTAEDVIHSWTVPSFGVKQDGEPGRINEIWFNIDTPGIYYGQCSELCGIQHGYMPIKVRAVTSEEFDAWVKQAQGKFDKAESDNTPAPSAAANQVAQVDTRATAITAPQVQPAN